MSGRTTDVEAAWARQVRWWTAPNMEKYFAGPANRRENPTPPPRIHVRPWWFPVQELRNPLVFYLEAWLADIIFGTDRIYIPQMQWLSQVLLTVDKLKRGDFVEIAIFGRPCKQNRTKKVLLNLASWHRQRHNRAEKMQQLEDSLKGPLLDPDFA